MLDKMNGKIVILGLVIVVLGLWVNALLGCENDIPVENDTYVVEYTE